MPKRNKKQSPDYHPYAMVSRVVFTLQGTKCETTNYGKPEFLRNVRRYARKLIRSRAQSCATGYSWTAYDEAGKVLYAEMHAHHSSKWTHI